MRYSVAEKREIIHLVEHSDLLIKQTLEELDVPRSSFYRWYQRFQEEGMEGLETKPRHDKRFWNRIPDSVREQVVELALEHPDQSCRQLAWQFTDENGYFIPESSVYRILKGYDLLENPAFEIIPVKEKFEKPNRSTRCGKQISPNSRLWVGVGTTSQPCWMIIPATSCPGS
jgi:putative transposase